MATEAGLEAPRSWAYRTMVRVSPGTRRLVATIFEVVALAVLIVGLSVLNLNLFWRTVFVSGAVLISLIGIVGVSDGVVRRHASLGRVLLILLAIVIAASLAAVHLLTVFPHPLRGPVALLLVPLALNLYYTLVARLRLALFFHPREPDPVERDDWPEVAVLMAARNEPADVVQMTLDSVLGVDYPRERVQVMLVDNSDSEHPGLASIEQSTVTLDADPELAHVSFMHRDGVEGFKPRNLDMAMRELSQPYVMLLDVDSTLSPSTLREAVDALEHHPRLGFVQLSTIATNGSAGPFARDSALYVTLLRQSIGYLSAAGGFLFFYGHNGVWRRSALDRAGPWEQYHRGQIMIGEDRMLSLAAQTNGIPGLAMWSKAGEWVPMTVKEFHTTLLRWNYAMLQSLFRDGFRLLGSMRTPFLEKFDEVQRELFTVACAVLPLAPLTVLISNKVDVVESAYLATYTLIALVSAWAIYRHFHSPDIPRSRQLRQALSAAFLTGSFAAWIAGKAAIRYLVGIKQGWKPTGKGAEEGGGVLQLVRAQWGVSIYATLVIAATTVRFVQLPWHNLGDTIKLGLDLAFGASYALFLLGFLVVAGSQRAAPHVDTRHMTITEVGSPFE